MEGWRKAQSSAVVKNSSRSLEGGGKGEPPDQTKWLEIPESLKMERAGLGRDVGVVT